MKVTQFTIQSDVFDELAKHLSAEIEHKHTYRSADTVLLAGEEYRFRTNSAQFYYIAVRRDAGNTFVEINCGGGGEGFWGITWGSETAFISSVSEKIYDFCKNQGCNFEENEVI